MPFIQSNGIKVHHITLGEGPDVVMLHGFLGNLAVWHLNMTPNLRRHGYRISTYDIRGHGYSEVTPDGYTTENLALDLLETLDALDIQSAHLVGHSYGADVCLHFALLYPDRVNRLVAVEPGLPALVEERKKDNWEGWSYWAGKLEEVGVKVSPEHRSDIKHMMQLSLETPKFYGPARGLPRKRGALLNLINNTTLINDYEVVGTMTLESIRNIDTEILLTYGSKSHFLGTYEFLKNALPNCTPVLLPGGEHFGPLEQPELLTKHMVEFFNGA